MKRITMLLTATTMVTLLVQSCAFMPPPEHDGHGPHHGPRHSPRPTHHRYYGEQSVENDNNATYKFSAQESTTAETPFADEKQG